MERLGVDKNEILEIQDEAIALLESQGEPFCDTLAGLYQVKGSIL